jgi:hypothetical protein
VVVAVGLTLIEPLADVEVNVPGVIAMLVVPAADQLSVLLEPEFMLVGFAVKDVIVGTEPFPDGAFDEYPEAQPKRPAHAAKARMSAYCSNAEEISPRQPSLLPQTR